MDEKKMDEKVGKTYQPKVPVEPQAPPERPHAPPPVKKKRSVVGFLLGLIIFASLGYAIYRVAAPGPQPQTAPSTRGNRAAAGGPQSVGVATISKGDIRIIYNGLGTVTPLATVTVRTQINGQLTEVAF